MQLLKTIVLVCIAAVALAATDHVIAGDFTSVDSLVSRGWAAFRHTGGDTRRYPNGQWVSPLVNSDKFGSLTTVRAYADDGAVVGINSAATGVAANSELVLLHNGTGQILRRLFGFNGFFSFDGMPNPSNPNTRTSSNYVGLIQNVALLGSAPSHHLVVCLGAGTPRLLVGNTSLPNPSNTDPPTPLGPQLLLFSGGSSNTFFATGFQVNTPINAQPTVITPQYNPGTVDANAQPGVDCSSLRAAGSTVMIRSANNGPYYLTYTVGSVTPTTWTRVTRDPNVAPNIALGPGISPIVNSLYFLGADGGAGTSSTNPTIYWYGSNPSDTTLVPDDAFLSFYRYTAGASWTLVMPTTVSRNITVTQFVVGPGGDTEIYFTLAPASNPDTLPSPIDDIRMPVEDYPFVGGSQGLAYVAPLYQLQTNAINLYFDVNLGSLIVHNSDLSGATVGNRLTYRVPDDDRRYFSKAYNYIVRYDSTNQRYVPAYGGAFDGAPSRIVATPGVTYFEGAFSYVFQRFTGPLSVWNKDHGWSYGPGAAFERVDIDGGDFRGMLNSYASIYDIERMRFLGNDGWIVGGQFRTADAGTVPCNSICFFPSNGNAKVALFDSPSSSFYNNTGVRLSDPITASAIIPEHADSVPGLVTNVVVNTQGETSIYVGGTFNIAGDKAASNFAIFTVSAGRFSTGWDNAHGGVDGPVLTMIKHDGAVYIGGNFKTVGTTIQAKNIAGFNVRTRQWFTLNRGLDGTVYKLIEQNGKLLAVGSFVTGSGQTLGYTGIWDGEKWSPLTVDTRQPGNNCLRSYCYALEIPGSPAGVYDAFRYGETTYMMLSVGSGLQLIEYVNSKIGFVQVDGGDSRNASPQFTTAATTMPGVSYISTSPYGKRRLDLWNIEQTGDSNFLQTKRVSTFNLDYLNFENNAGTGTNGLVYIALPEKASSSISLVASIALLIASLVFLLF